MIPGLLSLDDPAARDPSVVGAKAAWLAEGRRGGLDVLPGVVIPAAAARPAFGRGVEALETRGSGGARLVVTAAPLEPWLVTALAAVPAALGERLVVRSSSRLESGEWAGAFTSYVDIAPSDLPVAVRGCWASAFSVDALGRFDAAGLEPGSVPMAVLIQPALDPAAGGAARLDGDLVQLVGGPGSPVAVLQGWEPGVSARVDADGRIEGAAAVRVLGEAAIRAVARAVREAAERTGATAVEWACVGERVVLLQLGPGPRTEIQARPPDHADLRTPLAVAFARLVRRAPGPLGEALVLPWAGAAADAIADLLDEAGAGSRQEVLDVGGLIGEARRLADEATTRAWSIGPTGATAAARDVLLAVRGPDPGPALRRLAALEPPEPDVARRLVTMLAALRVALARAEGLSDPELAWRMDPRDLDGSAPIGRAHRTLGRIGMDRWEPFSAAVTFANGVRATGAPASGGIGAGPRCWIPGPAHADAFRSRAVLMTPRPLPQLAPLLWDAAGLVTLGGGPGAHLVESARALGIPAVTGLDAESLDGLVGDAPLCLALDGWSGDVFAVGE